MKAAGRILFVLLLCILTAGVAAEAKQPKDIADYEGAVRAYFNDQYLVPGDTDYAILYDVKETDWLEKNVPQAILVQAYGTFDMPHETATFILLKKRVYAMPDEFNAFITDAKVKISSEDDALGLADLYVKAWEPSGTSGVAAATVVTTAADIPQRHNPVPPGLAGKIKPQKIHGKPEGFIVSLQSWSEMGGWLRDWALSIDSSGLVTGENILIGEYVGDCFIEGARAERFLPKEDAVPAMDLGANGGGSGTVSSLGDGPHTQDVVIGGATRFVIHWRDEDIDALSDYGSPAQTVAEVESALRNAWQELIVSAGFSSPADTTIDVYIWNDTAAGSWGPIAHNAGDGAMWHLRGGEHYIYTLNRMIYWGPLGGYNWYWQNAGQAHDGVDGHELFHAIQYGYGVLGCNAWIPEGSARFVQTILTPGGEFWQNTALAGLPLGTYSQDSTHASPYIRESEFYLTGADNGLDSRSYAGCTYWRYIFEHRGGLPTVRSIFEGIKASPPGGSFNAEMARINAVLGTTDIAFTDFATANYQEFSPYVFARDDDFYDYSDRYYPNVHRESLAVNTGSAFPVTRARTLPAMATMYYDIDAGNVKRLEVSFNGDDTGSFAVKVFSGTGTTVTELPFTLNGQKDGIVTVNDADTTDVAGLMVARTGTAGSGGFSIKLEKANAPPVAEAKGPYSAPEGTPILLDASGSTDPDGDPLEYRWDVDGDGTFEIPWTGNAQVSYTACDNFAWTAKLEVRDWDATSTDTATITTTNEKPDVDAGPDQSVSEGDGVSFGGTASDAGSCDTLSYSWDFGDGTPAVEGTLTPSHTYCDNGVYTVTLTVTDDDGGSTADSLQVTVQNVPPIAEAGPDQTAPEGQMVSFSGTISDSGTCDTFSYSWDFGDGSAAVTDTLTPTHTYGDNGLYTVTLTVSDDDGATVTDTLTVTVTNIEPTVTKGTMDQPNPQFILPKVHTLTFHGTFADQGWLDTHTALWSFGDGTTDPGVLAEENVPPDATGTVTATHAYMAPGDYLVTVTVTDDDGGAGTSATWAIHVADVVEAKHDLGNYIQALPPSAFKGNTDQRKAALANKIAALDDMITRKEWNGFITSLVSDVRSKADGHVDGKANDDWIKDAMAQDHICMKIDDIVAYVKTFM